MLYFKKLKRKLIMQKTKERDQDLFQSFLRLKDRGDVTPIQIGEIINKDKRTVQRVLKKLSDNNLIEWFGTSIKDPKKIYRIKN